MAAYAARAGMRAKVFLPQDVKLPFARECQLYGADVTLVDGLITDAARVAAEQGGPLGWYDVTTLKEPYRIEGKKTMAYELYEQLGGRLPDVLVYPTGGGTGLVGMWKAFGEMRALGWPLARLPRLVSVQMEGCAPVTKAFSEGADKTVPWPDPATRVWGLRVPSPIGGFICLRALRETSGTAIAVTEADAATATHDLASRSGLDICPEGGAAYAAFEQLRERGVIADGETAVVFNTGTGLKYR
jgi:threonine synthase